MRAQRFAAILCTSLAVAIALRVVTQQRGIKLKRSRLAAAHLKPASNQTGRRIYPFSVIPGGAYSAEELALARRIDSVVAAHYANFDSDSVELRTLSRDELMYVSYRKANRIFWTLDKRRIPRGETVLSDGKHMARTRCGNRLSAGPQFPVLYGPQPTDAVLNAPELPGPLDLPKAPLFAAAYDAPVLPLDGRPRFLSFPTSFSAASPEEFPASPTYFPLFVMASGPWPGLARPSAGGPATGGGGQTPSGGGPVIGGGPGSGGGSSLPAGGSSAGVIPEPASVTLFGIGLSGLLLSVLSARRSMR